MASKLKKSEFAGKGAFVQLLGIIACFLFFPFGLIAGVLLLIIGGRLAIVTKCSDCRSTVDKAASVCPQCRATFD